METVELVVIFWPEDDPDLLIPCQKKYKVSRPEGVRFEDILPLVLSCRVSDQALRRANVFFSGWNWSDFDPEQSEEEYSREMESRVFGLHLDNQQTFP